jgi:hypothetical protein
MAAQRVPPSAWMTSQSTQTVRSPSASMSTIARSERPIRRWISTVRPSCRPCEASRGLRSAPVEPGSIPYSAETQPRPRPRSQGGTRSSTEAVQMTRVRPIEMRALPCAVSRKPGMISTGRNSAGWRPSARTGGRLVDG